MTIWKFVCYLLSLKNEKKESNINIVRKTKKGFIFRVHIPNQKRIKTVEEKYRAWSVILKYAKLIGKSKPVDAGGYTDIRRNFLTGIVKMTSKDGKVKRLQISELVKLRIHHEKEYVYFLYEGFKIPTQNGGYLFNFDNMDEITNVVSVQNTMPVDLVADIAQTNGPKNPDDIEMNSEEVLNETQTSNNDPELYHIFTFHEDEIEYNDQWLNDVWLKDINNRAEEEQEQEPLSSSTLSFIDHHCPT